MSFHLGFRYDYNCMRSGTASAALLAAQSHFVNGGGFHDGLLLNIDDVTANRVGRNGQVNVSDTSSLGLRFDVRQANGLWQSYIAAQPDLFTPSWTQPGGGWTFDGNTVSADGTGSYKTIYETLSLDDGDWFYLRADVTLVSGTIRIYLGDHITGTSEWLDISASGQYEIFWKAVAGFDQAGARTQQYFNGSATLTCKKLEGNHMVAAADDERGTYDIDGDGVAGNTLDGVNDAYETASLGSTDTVFDFLLEVDTSDTKFMAWSEGQVALRYLGAAEDGNSSTALTGDSGSPTIFLDGLEFAGTTRDELNDAIRGQGPTLIEIRDADVSAWVGGVATSKWAAWQTDGLLHNAVIFPSSQRSEAQTKDHRNYLLGQAGQPLIGDSVYNIFDASKVATAAVGSFNDLTDLTSLFQGRGDTNVIGDNADTVGDSVGFVVDKSIIGSRSFAAFLASQTELSPNTEPVSINEPGAAVVHSQSVSVTAGTHYYAEVVISNHVAGQIRLEFKSGQNTSYLSASANFILPPGSSGNVQFRTNTPGFEGDVSISIKEVPGIHWYAEADDERPTLQQTDAEVRYLEFDGVNDTLRCTAPDGVEIDAAGFAMLALQCRTGADWMPIGGGLTGEGVDYQNYFWLSAANTYVRVASQTAGLDLASSLRKDGESQIIGFSRPSGTDIKLRQDRVQQASTQASSTNNYRVRQIGGTFASQYFGPGWMHGFALGNRAPHGVELYNVEQHFEDLLTPEVHALFNDGAGGIRKGGLFDSGDLTSMYQYRGSGSSGGVNPTTGDSVGIWLDKKHMGGLTAEAFIANQPDLHTNDYVLSAGISQDEDTFTFDGTNALFANARKSLLVDGDFYVVDFTIAGFDPADDISVFGGTNGQTPNMSSLGNGTYRFAFFANSTNLTFRAQDANISGTITVHGVKHIPGDHLVAAADDERPTLTVDGVDGDGVNDGLYWSVNPLAGATEGHAIARAKLDANPPDSGSNGALIGDFGSATADIHQPYQIGPDLYEAFGATARYQLGSMSAVGTDWYTFELDINTTGNVLTAIANEQTIGSQAGVSIGWGADPRLFNSNDNAYWNGSAKRFVIIDKRLTDYELKAARNWVEENG